MSQKVNLKVNKSCLCNLHDQSYNLSFSGKIFCRLLIIKFFWKTFDLKTIFLFFLFTALGSQARAQQDSSLLNRLHAMLKYTQVKDIDKVLDYTYPKLFTIAPRALLLNSMKETYETEEYIIELDSINIHTVFPIFKIADTSYVKVKHTMLMKMKYKQPYNTSDGGNRTLLVNLMAEKYGKGNVRFDPKENSLNIFMIPDLVGVKPGNSQWTFANLNEDNPALLEILFSKKVRDKLNEFK